ncbi:MAG: hypothetical protein A2Z01_07780 [Betaproteobacteria bacterium RBG_16_58_11]|nr:MAG: hypothetical protein A2Z01_07780 [Betaproteobacteria bacterium RBG_16_58_11]
MFLALSLVLFAAQPVAALVISDGSSGVFRPISDFTLDLSGLTVPQYSSIYIDAGIKLTILTPTGGAFGDLLAANDIFVNGIIDAGSGSLGLLAGNQIVLRAGSQIIAGSLNVFAQTLLLAGTISADGGTINIDTTSGSSTLPGSNTGGSTISVPGADPNRNSFPPGTVVLEGGGGSIDLRSGNVRLSAVPEPSTILLLLPGLVLLARGPWRKAAP